MLVCCVNRTLKLLLRVNEQYYKEQQLDKIQNLLNINNYSNLYLQDTGYNVWE